MLQTEASIIVLNQEEVDELPGGTAARRAARKLALHPNYVPPNT